MIFSISVDEDYFYSKTNNRLDWFLNNKIPYRLYHKIHPERTKFFCPLFCEVVDSFDKRLSKSNQILIPKDKELYPLKINIFIERTLGIFFVFNCLKTKEKFIIPNLATNYSFLIKGPLLC